MSREPMCISNKDWLRYTVLLSCSFVSAGSRAVRTSPLRKLITYSTLTDKNSVITVTKPPAILMKPFHIISCHHNALFTLLIDLIIGCSTIIHWQMFSFCKSFFEFSKKGSENVLILREEPLE